jgi:hypothetical protein
MQTHELGPTGEAVHRFAGARSVVEDQDSVSLRLAAGNNPWLIRVDNYGGSGGFVGRLVDRAGAPLRGLTVWIEAPTGTPELPQPLPWWDWTANSKR